MENGVMNLVQDHSHLKEALERCVVAVASRDEGALGELSRAKP
jgi:hypothetical protein